MKLFEVSNSVILEVGVQSGIAYITGGRAVMSLPILMLVCIFLQGTSKVPIYFETMEMALDEIAEVGIADPYETVRGTTTLIWTMMVILIWFMETGKVHTECGLGMVTFLRTQQQRKFKSPSRIRTICSRLDNDGNEELFFNNIGEANRFFEKQKMVLGFLPILEMLLKRMVWELVQPY